MSAPLPALRRFCRAALFEFHYFRSSFSHLLWDIFNRYRAQEVDERSGKVPRF